MKQLIAWFRAAFPNMKMTPEEVFAAEATVIGRGSWRGTHRGVFQGIYPTGTQVRVPYIDIWRVKDGKFVESWVQMDILGLMQQLGGLPNLLA